MKYLYWSIFILLSFILQSRVSVIGVSLNLTVLLAYYAGIRYGAAKGMLTGALIGALEDSLSLSIFGPNMLAKGSVGFFSSFFVTGKFFRWTPLSGIFAVLFLTLADNAIIFLSRSMFDKTPAALSMVLFSAIMQSFLNAPAGIFIRPKNAD